MDKWTEGEIVSPGNKSTKPSRWWVLYHIWGGICLKTYADVSGLSKSVLGAPVGSDPASASSYAGSAAMVSVGAVVLGYFLSKSLIDLINRGAIPNKGKIALKFVFPIIYFLVAVFLAMATTQLLAKSNSVQKTSMQVSQETVMKPVVAFTTAQSSEGVTAADLDQAGLENLETWIVETLLQQSRGQYAEMGYNPEDFNPRISANSVYVTTGDEKLAVIKVNIDSSIRSVTVMGIKGDQLLRVSCIRASDHDIPVWSGECGNEVRKTFMVSIQP